MYWPSSDLNRPNMVLLFAYFKAILIMIRYACRYQRSTEKLCLSYMYYINYMYNFIYCLVISHVYTKSIEDVFRIQGSLNKYNSKGIGRQYFFRRRVCVSSGLLPYN